MTRFCLHFTTYTYFIVRSRNYLSIKLIVLGKHNKHTGLLKFYIFAFLCVCLNWKGSEGNYAEHLIRLKGIGTLRVSFRKPNHKYRLLMRPIKQSKGWRLRNRTWSSWKGKVLSRQPEPHLPSQSRHQLLSFGLGDFSHPIINTSTLIIPGRI